MIDNVPLICAAESLDIGIATIDGIPLIGYDQLELKDASAAPLISILADMLLTQCTRPALAPANAQPVAA